MAKKYWTTTLAQGDSTLLHDLTPGMFQSSLRFHARLDVRTSDDLDFQVMQLLTRSRMLEKECKGLVSSVRKTLGQDPRKPRSNNH